ncbi:MAG: hypothetical protein IKN42_00265 [Elusimicrobia bacterium]|nr:hypothetical protein [Elusimicrobiota bacterium]
MEMDDYLENLWANFLYDMSNYSVITQILIVLFCFAAFVYFLQIVILVIV